MQTAMVWGANGGIGRALTARLAADGWRVVALARHPVDVAGPEPVALECDMSDPASVRAAVMAAAMEIDTVDLWIYAAGAILSAPVADLQPAGWDRVLAANLTGAYLAAQASLPLLAADAHLVFIGAISERLRLPGLAAYAAAKAGIEAFADVLRKEQRERRVTLVRPGAVRTALWEGVSLPVPPGALEPEALADQILAAHAAGESGTLDIPASRR